MHAIIIALKAQDSDTEIVCLLKVAQLFVVKFQKELEAFDVDPTTAAK